MVKEITDNGGQAIAVQADVSNEADVIRLFEETNTAFGPLDILVNNAVYQGYLPVEQISVAAFQRQCFGAYIDYPGVFKSVWR